MAAVRRLVLLAAVVPVSWVVACGSDTPAVYSDETRANVLAGCRAETDRPLVVDLCACTYRSVRSAISYERFQEIDQQLRESPDAPLPDDVVALLAGCIIDVANL